MDDYVLNPATVQILRFFEEGHDAFQRSQYNDSYAVQGSDFVASLDDFTKGVVIIDLATLVDGARQALLIIRTDAVTVGFSDED